MAEKLLSEYMKEYSSHLLSKVGKEFSFDTFLERTKASNIKPSGLSQNYYSEDIDFPWLEELEMVTEKIMAIASKPRTHIKVEKDVKKAEQAVKIDNFDIIETIKVPAYWKKKGSGFLPEKVYTDIFEIEYAIYENRFIINLVDKMMLFLSQIITQLYGQIKKVGHHFIDSHVSISDMDIVQDMALKTSDDMRIEASKRIRHAKDSDATLLTTNDSPYVDALRRILISRATVGHVRSTPFYKDVKKAKPLSDTDVHLTNMLAGDPTYAPCYNFYLKLLLLMGKRVVSEEPVDPKDYHNYVMSNLISSFQDLGFVAYGRNKPMYIDDGILHIDHYRLRKGNGICCTVTSHDEDHVDLLFELEGNDIKRTTNYKNKKESLVSIDIVPSTTAEYPNVEELSEYFENKIRQRLMSGYVNAFVVTPVDNTQKDNVIICSPKTYKIDANVKSMIDSCTVFAEGDNYIYAHVCPVCGFYVDGEQEDGNCYCANCDSAYALLARGNDKQLKESVWIKRLKNPDRI